MIRFVVIAWLALSILEPTHARANVNVHTYSPTANPAYTFSEDALSNSEWSARGQGRVLVGAFYDLIDDPLVELNADRTERRATLIDSFNSLNLAVGYGLLPELQLGASTSATLATLPDGTSETGFGDTRLYAKLRLTSVESVIGLAVMPELWLPTGSRALYLSSGSVGGGVRLIAEHDFGAVLVSGNAGLAHSPNAVFRDLDLRATVPLSLSALVPLGMRWALNFDASGELSLPLNSYQNPTAFYAGARNRLTRDLVASAGAAVGAVNSHSSAEFRIIAGLVYSPRPGEPGLAEQPARATPVSAVDKKLEEINLVLEDVRFLHNQATLTPAGRHALDEAARLIHENTASIKSITIEGHANELGGYPYNQKLSERRALSVQRYLVSKGVAASVLPTIAYGKTKPKAPRSAPRPVRLVTDRRVEFKFRKAPIRQISNVSKDVP